MKITSAEFLKSSTGIAQLPKKPLPAFAFVGRSNVGKSSLINMLMDRKQLAKTSQNPGKTRTINHYLINEQWYMVDLPGYGYAKTSVKERKQMLQRISEYLLDTCNLINLFVLLDSTIKPQPSDLQFMEWLGVNEIPFSMVFTKIDKIKDAVLKNNINRYREEMLKAWEFLPKVFCTSAVKKYGKEEILIYISELLNG